MEVNRDETMLNANKEYNLNGSPRTAQVSLSESRGLVGLRLQGKQIYGESECEIS